MQYKKKKIATVIVYWWNLQCQSLTHMYVQNSVESTFKCIFFHNKARNAISISYNLPGIFDAAKFYAK